MDTVHVPNGVAPGPLRGVLTYGSLVVGLLSWMQAAVACVARARGLFRARAIVDGIVMRMADSLASVPWDSRQAPMVDSRACGRFGGGHNCGCSSGREPSATAVLQSAVADRSLCFTAFDSRACLRQDDRLRLRHASWYSFWAARATSAAEQRSRRGASTRGCASGLEPASARCRAFDPACARGAPVSVAGLTRAIGATERRHCREGRARRGCRE